MFPLNVQSAKWSITTGMSGLPQRMGQLQSRPRKALVTAGRSSVRRTVQGRRAGSVRAAPSSASGGERVEGALHAAGDVLVRRLVVLEPAHVHRSKDLDLDARRKRQVSE